MVHLWTCFLKFLNKNQWNALFSNICTHTIVHSEIKQGWHFSDSFVVSPWFTEKQFFSVQPSTRWKQIVNNRSFCGWTTKSWISIEQNVCHFWQQFQVHQECTNILHVPWQSRHQKNNIFFLCQKSDLCLRILLSSTAPPAPFLTTTKFFFYKLLGLIPRTK